jgi:hypothetical protein
MKIHNFNEELHLCRLHIFPLRTTVVLWLVVVSGGGSVDSNQDHNVNSNADHFDKRARNRRTINLEINSLAD